MVKNRQMRFKQMQRCIVVKKYFGVRCTLPINVKSHNYLMSILRPLENEMK